MRLFTLRYVLVFVVTVTTAAAARAGETIEIPCTLEVGDVVDLAFTRGREQSGPGAQPTKASVTNTTRFQVRERNDTGFVLSWKSDWHELTDMMSGLGGGAKSDWVEEFLEKLSEYELLIQTDELSTPLHVLNMEETMALFEDVMAAMFESLDLKDEEKKAVEATVGQMLNAEFLVSRFLQDANLYFMFTGASLELAQEYLTEGEVASPFGGPSIPSEITYLLESIDTEANVAVTKYREVTDGEAVKELMKKMFAQLPNGDEILREMEGAQMGIVSSSRYEMNLETGLPKSFQFERTVEMGPGKRVDTIAVVTSKITR